MSNLTLEEKATNSETMAHIQAVQSNIFQVIYLLLERARMHDQSKLTSPEVQIFTEATPKLATLTYGSPEYEANLREIKPALDHHYAKNRHHPQHFATGVNGMNLIDVIEMFCDWRASTERQNDGNIHRSLEVNAERFRIDAQLLNILSNTVEVFEK